MAQVVAIHGGLDQEERHEAIRSFKEGSKVQLQRDFFTKKKTKQNVNVSMCYLVSDGDGFILVFFFFGGGKAGSVVTVGFCIFLWMETPMQQKNL